MISARQSRVQSSMQSQAQIQPQDSSNGNDASHLPPVPAPPSARVMQGLGGRDEVREEMMRMLSSFSEHLSFANSHVSSLPARKTGRQGGDSDVSQ